MDLASLKESTLPSENNQRSFVTNTSGGRKRCRMVLKRHKHTHTVNGNDDNNNFINPFELYHQQHQQQERELEKRGNDERRSQCVRSRFVR